LDDVKIYLKIFSGSWFFNIKNQKTEEKIHSFEESSKSTLITGLENLKNHLFFGTEKVY
jgi:hypothetical protein